MTDLFNYQRRKSNVVHVGNIDIGGDNPIRIQSMTTTDTNDTQACVELSLIHISEPTRLRQLSRMPSSA